MLIVFFQVLALCEHNRVLNGTEVIIFQEAFLKKEKTNVLDRNTIIQLIKEYTANMRMLDNQIEKVMDYDLPLRSID